MAGSTELPASWTTSSLKRPIVEVKGHTEWSNEKQVEELISAMTTTSKGGEFIEPS